ncbi:MAG: hypothetical protein ACP5IL_02770 [Syntrophobacteraceae bacterium]
MASDLAGSWVYEGLDIGATFADWSSANMQISGSGTMTGTSTKSDGTQKNISGNVSLSSTGELTCVSGSCGSGPLGYLDAGKSVAAWVGSDLSNNTIQDSRLQVLLKNATQYSIEDLFGSWYINQLDSDGTWRRLFIQVFRGGAFSSLDTKSDGTTATGAGRLAISSSGQVSCVSGSCSDVSLVMDASKTVMAGVYTDTSGADAIEIATKTTFWSPGDVPLGNGWEYSYWFGYVSTANFPWLYHATLGWLWAYETSPDDIWFYDPRWDGKGGWWWTSSTMYPWIYSLTEGTLLYCSPKSKGGRWFGTISGKWATH